MRSNAACQGCFRGTPRRRPCGGSSGTPTRGWCSIRSGLTHSLTDQRIPLDNHAAERALRGSVVGRKNHYGSRSIRGNQVAARFYTLCESARLVGVDAHAYLRHALNAALITVGTVTLRDALLPIA